MKDLVAFISCVNNEDLYSKCLYHIKKLDIPEGYTYETIAIRGAKSLASGYNQAMNQSKAKFKVYLHQDTFIINTNFIFDILRIFEKKLL
ncbi:MAG TPA: glycosyltransferase [Sporomusa sphaeroides]|nr:glycosyltransferase [Sporomusa sphaeroides]